MMTLIAKMAASIITAVIVMPAANAQDDKNFDGLFLGGEFGSTIVDTNSGSQAGFYYGGIIGYRKQMESGFVFGLEGTLGDSDGSIGSSGFSSAFDSKINRQWTASLLFGKTFGASRKNLVFGKIGYNELKSRIDLNDRIPTDLFPTDIEAPRTDDGILLGAGYERSINKSINMRFSVDYAKQTNLHEWQPKLSLLLKF